MTAAKLCPGSLKADGPCEHGEYDVHPVRSAATVERSEREQILESFYDSITGILFLHDEGRMGHTSALGEVRHSTQRCEAQLQEVESDASE